ncbi:UNVERIFIED_CONTAM: hypothetical protein PYX00_003308 [Menopon gallinae]|uniref:Uncharacterized protein n=1 Tax=Menopon gallinae TaxID=328185 RepID=A0AAW2I1W0_9NEOP
MIVVRAAAVAFLLGLFLQSTDGSVFITVSSLPGRKVELNWALNDTVDTVSLHLNDPEGIEDSEALVNVTISDYPNGYYKTDIEFNPEPFPGGWSYEDDGNEETEDGEESSRSFCLYWIAAVSDGQIMEKNCLGIEPAWMSEYRAELRRLTLPKLFLPGTHNSGCDKMKLGRVRRGSKIDSFVLTQDQSIWNQLVYGIRFLDLRIGYYTQVKEKEDLRFWINHDLLGVQPLIPVLRDIKRFAESSPEEVIVLDFHRFPVGFKRKTAAAIHRDLVSLIGWELGDLILPRPKNASELTLEDIWKTKQRIVISYNNENSVRETPWLWDPVIQKWGNKQTPSDLEKFLNDSFKDIMPKNRLWAAMAELTPTPLDFLNDSSLRSMADSVNRLLSFWFEENEEWTSNANIVATDFFLGNNLVQRAIEENLRRAKELD